jgi:hypothetical protein
MLFKKEYLNVRSLQKMMINKKEKTSSTPCYM